MKMERMMERRVNVKFFVKLQKSPTGQTPLRGVEIEKLPQTKQATDIEVQHENNVDIFFDIWSIIHLQFLPEGTTVKQTFYVEVLKRFMMHEAQARIVI
jgi:hypothetical protein